MVVAMMMIRVTLLARAAMPGWGGWLVVLAETRERGQRERQQLREAINRAVVEVLGEPADQVVLVPPGTILKTSSGKLRRAATRALFESGLAGEQWSTIVMVRGAT
jgi:acyl-CoA synthetase (AMP-forming)/AMP-acid ligase II